MANPELTINVSMNLTVDEKTLDRALHIVELWLEDHPGKTIVVEKQGELRECLIVDEAKAHEAELPGPWISVKDRLPEKDGLYLCWMGGSASPALRGAEYSTEKVCFWNYYQDVPLGNITHWMPMIEGPKEEANGEEQGE